MSKLYFLPVRPAFDSAGITVPGSQHWFTLAGTNTPSAPFTDATLATPLENPVVANGVGYLPPVYLDETISYRVRIYLPHTRVGVATPIEEYDPYTPAAAILTYLGDDGFDGLLADTPSLIVPDEIDAISTTGADELDHGGAVYVAGTAPTSRSGFTSANGRNFVLSQEQVITPQMFYQATDPDAQNMVEGARDYLNTFTLNAAGGGFYNGAPTLMCPAAPTYLMHDRVDFFHTGKIRGEGSGQFGPGAGGATHFKWIGATSGFGIQGPNTSGLTTVDVTTHNGSGGIDLEDMCLEGDGGAEGDHHLLVLRAAIKGRRLYLKNARGEAVKAWAGNVIGNGSVGGNLSTTFLEAVKAEGCRGGFDFRGSDANVITTLNCEGYQNRWFGLLDDNGAGANTHIGFHAASNGVVTGTWAQTQTSYSGRRKALRWGGDPTVAPSVDTTDTANWYDIEAGAAIANTIPAWTATPNTFRAGGDILVLNSASVILINFYSENGGFSQFNVSTQVEFGSLLPKYFRGGTQMLPSNDGGRMIKSGRLANNFYLDTDATEAGVYARANDGTGGFGYLVFATGGGAYLNGNDGVHFRHGGVACGGIDNTGLALLAGDVVKVDGIQVVTARQTGTPADATDLATALTLVNALKAKLVTHGLIS